MSGFISIPVGDCRENNNAADDDDDVDEVIKLDAETETYFNSLPPGYCFYPTDTELIIDYLKRKLDNVPLPRNKMHEVNIYKYNPEKLSKKYPLTSKKEWYFFTPRDRKYCNGTRPNRAAGTGYWKASGADTSILDENQNQLVGFKKSLGFHEGKPPNGEKTNWLMHEFRVNAEPRKRTSTNDMKLDDFVLCRIYKNDSEKDNKNKQNKNESRNNDESLTINYPSFDYSQDQQIHICSLPQNYATPITTIAAPVNSMPMNSVDAAADFYVPDCSACASSVPVNSETATDDAAANVLDITTSINILHSPSMPMINNDANDSDFDWDALLSTPPAMQL